jgi:hypothetical protein
MPTEPASRAPSAGKSGASLHHLASRVRLAPSRGCGGTTRASQGLLRDLSNAWSAWTTRAI